MPYADPETRRIYHRDYKRRNRHRYRFGSKLYDTAKHANQRAAQYGASGTLTIDDVRAVLATGPCHYCGGSELLGIDHVVPLNAGGLNASENLVSCCRSCNASKWRGDRPHRWSRKFDQCQSCGRSDRRHIALGFCTSCYAVRFGHWAKLRARKALDTA